MSHVGDKEIFAIEWNIDSYPTSTHHHIGVNFCFWAKSQRIGDFEDSTYFDTIVGYMEEFLTHEKERNVEGNHLFSQEDAFSTLHEVAMEAISPRAELQKAFYGGLKDTENDYGFHSWLQNVFHLDDIGGACFLDKFSAILLSDEVAYTQRLIWKDWRKMELHEAILPLHCFESVANQFIEKARQLLAEEQNRGN